ncbi:MAG: universal stress protein [Mycobacterium sp.]|nr:MAG: universal stress protein [Mycobacterium sp.]
MATRGTHLGIVVGVDGSPGSAIAVQWAAHDAALRDVPLTLAHAARTRSQRERGLQVLDQALRTVSARVRVRCEMPCATPVFALADLSEHAELVVVGCPGGGAPGECQFCSVSSTLIHHAHCPVVVIHDDVQLSPETLAAPVLVGIDASSEAGSLMEIAFEEASARGVGLVALHTCEACNGLDETSPALAGWTDRYPDVTVHQVAALTDPVPQLVDHAEKAQLVVVGTQGNGGFAAMLFDPGVAGTVTHVPIIVVRASPARAGA